MPTHFDWDENKARANLQKHGVRFEEAATVFSNPSAAILDDPDHSESEAREILVGRSGLGRILVVSFTERSGQVRIISARRATPREVRGHRENPHGGWGHDG